MKVTVAKMHGICNMKTVLFAAMCSVICVGATLALVSCNALAKDTDADNLGSGVQTTDIVKSTTVATTENTCQAQQILDGIYDNAEMRNGRMYLIFGARGTLTVENFNKLVLEQQLGLSDGRFTFVMDDNQLCALRHTSAYGGVGFGQDWLATLWVQIKDNETGEISDRAQLFLTLHKSYDADIELTSSKKSETNN